MMEVCDKALWMPIKGYEGLYEISNAGEVRGVDRVVATSKSTIVNGVVRVPPRTIIPCTSVDGYSRVRLCKNGVKKKVFVHVLVLSHFGEEKTVPSAQCRHMDGNPRNNCIHNLSWGTAQDNWRDRKRHGRGNEGGKNANARLTETSVKEIRTSNQSITEISERYGVTKSCVRHILSRRSWRHTA